MPAANSTVKPTTVAEYIAAQPEHAQPLLREVAAILRAAAPDATAAIKWRAPVWTARHMLFSLTAFKEYAAFGPAASTLDGFRAEVEATGLTTTQHTVHLRYGEPVPADLIRRIAEHRERDARENDVPWAAKV